MLSDLNQLAILPVGNLTPLAILSGHFIPWTILPRWQFYLEALLTRWQLVFRWPFQPIGNFICIIKCLELLLLASLNAYLKEQISSHVICASHLSPTDSSESPTTSLGLNSTP